MRKHYLPQRTQKFTQVGAKELLFCYFLRQLRFVG